MNRFSKNIRALFFCGCLLLSGCHSEKSREMPWSVDEDGVTRLMKAVSEGDQKDREMPWSVDEDGVTRLMKAVSEGDQEQVFQIVDALIPLEAIDQQDHRGMTALMMAAESGRLPILQKLVETRWHSLPQMTPEGMREAKLFKDEGANRDLQNQDGMTALMLAIQNGHPDAAKWLALRGANFDLKNNAGQTALDLTEDEELQKTLLTRKFIDLARNGRGSNFSPCRPEALSALFATGMVDINAKLQNGYPALSAAVHVCYGNPDMVQFFIDAGADLNARNEENGMTPLMHAAQREAPTAFLMLLLAGADPDLKNAEGKIAQDITPNYLMSFPSSFTPLYHTAVSLIGHADRPLTLRQWANLQAMIFIHNRLIHEAYRIEDRFLNAPLRRNADWADWEWVKKLIDAGADPNIVSSNRTTLLHVAVDLNDLKMLQVLIAAGADPNLQDISGNTPLIEAAWWKHPELVQALVAAGADLNLKNHDGKTAFEIAFDRGAEEIVQILRAAEKKAPSEDPSRAEQSDVSLSKTKENRPNEDASAEESLQDRLSQLRKDLAQFPWESNCDDIERLILLYSEDNQAEMVRLLLQAFEEHHGSAFMQRDHTKYSWISEVTKEAFKLAVEKGYEETVAVMLEALDRAHASCKAEAKESERCKEGLYDERKLVTELIHLTLREQKETKILRLLLASKKGVISGYDSHGRDHRTPLMQAVQNQNLDQLQALIEAGAETDDFDFGGDTALMRAIRLGNPQLVCALISAGADLNLQDRGGQTNFDPGNPGKTALMYAILSGNQEITRLLLEAGADFHQKDSSGADALVLALSRHQTEIVQALIEKGADPNQKIGEWGVTPLMIAASLDLLDMAQMLLSKKANALAQNRFQKTAFKLARTEAMKALLRSAEAKAPAK